MASTGINGTSLECVDEGSGTPLVLVHGSASDLRSWQAQREAFRARHRVVTYSRRYHWPNEPIAEGADYSMDEHVEDLRALVRSLGAPAHLVGSSYGAFLCLLLAIREPGLARSLVLAEPPVVTLFLDLPPKPRALLSLLARKPRTALGIMKFAATGYGPARAALRRGDPEAGMRTFGSAVLGADSYRMLPPERVEQMRANFVAAELLGSGFLPLSPDEVRGVRVPTLLVSGERSPAFFQRLTDGLAELLPNAERVTIAGASHRMHESDASAYNAEVLSFVGRHP